MAISYAKIRFPGEVIHEHIHTFGSGWLADSPNPTKTEYREWHDMAPSVSYFLKRFEDGPEREREGAAVRG